MTPEQILLLVTELKKLGVTNYENAGLKLSLGPDPIPAPPPVSPEKLARRIAAYDEAMTFAASEGYPVLEDSE